MSLKILLTAINAKYIHSNLAVYSLHSYVVNHHKEYQEEIEIAEYTINQQLDEILMDLYKKKPDVLCLSCYIWNIEYIKQLLPEVNKILPDTKIWLGGPEVSYDAAKEMKNYPQLSGIMCGEGEVTFLELAEHYHGEGKALHEIAGIYYRDGEEIVQTQLRPVTDLSTIPFVYQEIEKFKNKIIYYESSRGCPFSCSYCLSSIDKCLRFRDLELVKKELQYFIDHEIPQVKFVDRTFNCNHKHAMEIWTYLLEHDNGITNFHFEVAADLLNQEEIELISKMRPGLIQLEIGVQSTNPKTVKEIHRTMKFEKVSEIVKQIQSVGNIHQHLDLIAGLPYEDYESFRKSFNDVYALRPEQLQLGFLKVLKGSYMEEQTEAYDLVYQNRPPYEVLSTKWLPYEDVIRLKGVEEMVEVHYNSGQFVNTLELLETEFTDAFTMFEALRDYYEEQNLTGISHTRIARYEILYQFALEYAPEKKERYREKLTYDLYLRENVKNRPAFAGEATVSKEEAAEIYDREAETHELLPDYTKYDKRQLRKMTHLERVDGKILLFDYQNRSKLTNQARVCLAK